MQVSSKRLGIIMFLVKYEKRQANQNRKNSSLYIENFIKFKSKQRCSPQKNCSFNLDLVQNRSHPPNIGFCLIFWGEIFLKSKILEVLEHFCAFSFIQYFGKQCPKTFGFGKNPLPTKDPKDLAFLFGVSQSTIKLYIQKL